MGFITVSIFGATSKTQYTLTIEISLQRDVYMLAKKLSKLSVPRLIIEDLLRDTVSILTDDVAGIESFLMHSQLKKIGIQKDWSHGPGNLGSIPGRVIPKTQKVVLDATLLNTHHYKVRIKSKVEQSSERSSALPKTLV